MPFGFRFRFATGLTLGVLLAVTASGAFERPSENERLDALGNIFEEAPVLQRLLRPDDDFPQIPKPRPGDWLAQHREDGQTFAEYRDAGVNRPDAVRHIIYLQPLGDFPAGDSPDLEALRRYAAAFFQLDVRVLPVRFPGEQEFSPRINDYTHRRQILTAAVRTDLAAHLPADAFCLLGVTMTDLYPDPEWNYVFGEASLSERVGIYSFARYDVGFFGEPRPADYRTLQLIRAGKVLTHETAHMFGLPHCIFYKCLMNGANSLEEADRQPLQLCPVCLRKLHFNTGFDAVKRYQDLRLYYQQPGWSEAAAWVSRQLAKAAPPTTPPPKG